MRQPVRGVLVGMAIGGLAVTVAGVSAAAQTVEWPAYAADQAGTKYLPLDQINEDTVGDLEIDTTQHFEFTTAHRIDLGDASEADHRPNPPPPGIPNRFRCWMMMRTVTDKPSRSWRLPSGRPPLD